MCFFSLLDSVTLNKKKLSNSFWQTIFNEKKNNKEICKRKFDGINSIIQKSKTVKIK